MRALRLALVSLVLSMTACKPAFDIRLATTKEAAPHPRFVITERDAPEERPRYHTVKLYDAETKTIVWHLRAKPFGDTASQKELTYGLCPSGFEEVVESAPLQKGRSYALIVIGTRGGQLDFSVEADGTITSK